MKYLFTASLAVTSMLCSSIGMAAPAEKITQCPSIEQIKMVGVHKVRVFPDHAWRAISRSKYGTEVEWSFIFGSDSDPANDETEAREKAMQELKTLVYQSGPFSDEAGNTACLYDTDKTTNALALNPPLSRPVR